MLPLVVLLRVSLFFSCFLLVPSGGPREYFFWEVGYLCVVVPFLLCAVVRCVVVVLVFFCFGALFWCAVVCWSCPSACCCSGAALWLLVRGVAVGSPCFVVSALPLCLLS